MEISRLVLRRMTMTMKEPFQTSFGTQQERELMIVEAHSDEMIGYGECVASAHPLYSEETVDTASSITVNDLAPLLKSTQGINHPGEVRGLFSPIRRNNMAKSAVEGAIWDLYAKIEGKSLYDAIGGTKQSIEVGISIGIQPDAKSLVRVVSGAVEEGYKRVKMKIQPGADIDRVDAVREAFPDLPIMVDANSAYTLMDTSLLKQLDRYRLMMIEQPLAHDDIIDHATLQARIDTPVCLDESIHSLDDARKAIDLDSCRVINVKIGRVGGIAEALRIHDHCSANGVPVWCGGMLETGIGRAHNIAIATLPNFSLPGDTASAARYWNRDVVVPEIEAVRGVIDRPEGRGIGYEPDLAFIRELTTDYKEIPVHT